MKKNATRLLAVVLSILLVAGVGLIVYLLSTNLSLSGSTPLSIDFRSVEAGDIVTVSVDVRGDRVSRAELWTESTMIAREANRNPNLGGAWTVAWQWVPPAPGVYPLAARAFDETGKYAGTPPFEVVVPPHVGLLFASNRSGKYALYNMAIGNRQVTEFTKGTAEERQPSVSPMRLVAYASNRTGRWHIYARSLSQDNSTDLTPDLESAQSPVWSPDGQHLAFEATASGVTSIYTSDPRGGSRVRVTNGEAFDGQVSWSPDGKRIAFAGLRGGQWDIYTADTDGGNLARLTNDTAQDWQPAWSPDGARIAFASNREGTSQIYLMPANGSGEVQRATNFSVGAEQPVWSPDGNWLAYVGYTGEGESSNRREIYLEYAPKDKGLVEGRGLIRLTQNGSDDTEPAWVWQ